MGLRELAEFRQDEQGPVSGPRAYIFAATRRWMDPHGNSSPENGVDAWRLDAAVYIRHEFWHAWCEFAKKLNPQVFLMAEIIDRVEVIQHYLLSDGFDGVTHYNFAFTCSRFFIENQARLNVSEFDLALRQLRDAYPLPMRYALVNLYASHDTARLASQIVNQDFACFSSHTWFPDSKATNPGYIIRRPMPAEYQIQKLMAIFQMTYLGAPMIYYGDEAGMWGANECCRKPMVWPDLQFDLERTHPDGSQRSTPDVVAFDPVLFAHYRKLIQIRNQHPALQMGDFQTVLTDDARGIYGYKRNYTDQTILVILNNSVRSQPVVLPHAATVQYIDLLNAHESFHVVAGELTCTVAGKWGRILVLV
jgi:glycosidase